MVIEPSFGIPYDPRIYSFQEWADLMCELYGAQNLEQVNAATNWKNWGNGLKAIDVFTNESAPNTDGFVNWQDWAQALIMSVNPGGNA